MSSTRMRMCPVRLPRRSDGNHQARNMRTQVPLNVLIPLGGLSSNEFVEAGYRLPKPMVPIVGRPMLLWMLDNLELDDDDYVWLGVRRDIESKYSLSYLLRREYPKLKLKVVCFDFDTRGATETLYCILNAMDQEARSRRTISLDSDTLWFCDVLGGARALPPDVGASFYFNDTSDDASAPYSYIRVDASTSRIVDIREKVAISRLANNGAYVFPSGEDARTGLEALLDFAIVHDDCVLSASTKTENQAKSIEDFHHRDRLLSEEAETLSLDDSAMLATESEKSRYVSGLINHMMRRSNITFLAVLANDFANLGSPAKLQSFISRLRRGEIVGARAMRFCFGLDGTLLTPPRDPNWPSEEDNDTSFFKIQKMKSPLGGVSTLRDLHVRTSPRMMHRRGDNDSIRDFSTCRPIAKNIAIARELHDAGHTIIIWTDRGMRESGGSAASAMAQLGRITFEQLEKFDIPYDEIIFGKPHADVYVDAQAVNPLLGDRFETAIGWDLADSGGSGENSDLDSGIAPRHFNSIRRVGDDYIEKTGPRSVLRGEIFWYQHIPITLQELFPAAHAVREHPAQELSSVVLDRVVGVTYSHLVVNSCITPGRLMLLLNALNRLHREPYSTVVPELASPNNNSQPDPSAATFVRPDDVTEEMLVSNYRIKVEKRYTKHKTFFASFNDEKINTEAMATLILQQLKAYESAKRFQRCNYIHGDPVFSNVMLTTDSKVKFLDMRGCLGDTLTTAGDLNYDLSKVYQSLCGYDFMILDVTRSTAADIVLSDLRERVFVNWLKTQHPNIDINDIILITAAHFFCIVPLHENRKHQRLFIQASYSLLESLNL